MGAAMGECRERTVRPWKLEDGWGKEEEGREKRGKWRGRVQVGWSIKRQSYYPGAIDLEGKYGRSSF